MIESSSGYRYTRINDLVSLRDCLSSLRAKTGNLSSTARWPMTGLNNPISLMGHRVNSDGEITNLEALADLPGAIASRIARLHQTDWDLSKLVGGESDKNQVSQTLAQIRSVIDRLKESLVVTDSELWIEESLKSLRLILRDQASLAKEVIKKVVHMLTEYTALHN